MTLAEAVIGVGVIGRLKGKRARVDLKSNCCGIREAAGSFPILLDLCASMCLNYLVTR